VRGGAYFREPATHGIPREWSYRRKDGSVVPVSLVVTAMHTDDGRLMGYLGVSHDISEQKRHEQVLVESKAAAEQANLAKSQFLANMSHEIRTPMNAVTGLSFLLEQTQLDAHQSELLGKMTRASKTLLGVINDVLDLSKIEAGELGVSAEPFAPAALLRYVTEVMLVQAQIKGIGLTLEMATRLPKLLVGDSLRLDQILTNLLSNAIKFTDSGGVQLKVLALDTSADQLLLRFEVQDSGIGISAEAAKGLFQPFAQADASITRRFGGTGLGLSIVKQLAELMGGVVGLDSTPGTGSRFWVDLPFGLADEATARNHREPVGSSEAPSLHGMRVLVVDDSSINLEVARRILETAGAQVALRNDGQAAVDYLREQADACDVVLMDIHMPVLDGLSATRVIRQELGLRELPIVALTAGALASQREEARFVGMNDFIVKPFSPAKVISCIARYGRRGLSSMNTLEACSNAATATADWPSISGINPADVMHQLGGDLSLFRTLLGYLLQEFSAVPVPEGAGFDLLALAARLHKLRGGAGNLGASSIHALATQAEQACHDADLAAARAAVDALNQQLAELAASAQAWMQQPVPLATAVADTDGAQLSGADIQGLAALLKQQHVSAIERFEALAPSLRARLGDERFEQLREHVAQLQFAAAASLLGRND
jgi:signal transduction histidine kinase/CheY-like chemotaxis protein